MVYSDEEFREKFSTTIGPIKLFRRHLRILGKIQDRQRLTDEHIDLFGKVYEKYQESGLSWEKVMEEFLPLNTPPVSDEKDTNDLLREILDKLIQIESRLP